jgi:hypothetical protein
MNLELIPTKLPISTSHPGKVAAFLNLAQEVTSKLYSTKRNSRIHNARARLRSTAHALEDARS